MEQSSEGTWSDVLTPEWLPALAVLLGGVLLHSMNVLIVATVLPSIVEEVGGATMMSWPTTAFLASSILAATCTGLLTVAVGARNAYCAGALIFGIGALVCAHAASMGYFIAGRFVQGFGGGSLAAVAYILVRSMFPEAIWPRVLALISGAWSVSILLGPLAGGVFARHGEWRSVFIGVAALAVLFAAAAIRTLPRARRERASELPPVPGARVALICFAIIALSSAAVVDVAIVKAGLIALTLAALVGMLRLNRRAAVRLLPGDAFSLRSLTGVGLWCALLLAIAYSPLQIFVPLFLQRLHRFEPLGAGYAVAGASLGWTVAALAVAGLSKTWARRMLVIGPAVMTIGLLGVGLLGSSGPIPGLLVAILLVGLGIGMCWAFVAQRVMGGAAREDATIAASAMPTVQQIGLALGGAAAGLVANMAGVSGGDVAGIAQAAFWVPASFTCAAILAGFTGLRLALLTKRVA
ncbi:MAG: MFS transporter [Hyphomicrobiales bacterium]|nr:MFS transporter [Hyphomicrobiales bacterium]